MPGRRQIATFCLLLMVATAGTGIAIHGQERPKIKIRGVNIGPGQWIAYQEDAPLGSVDALKPLIGQFLFSGPVPDGVTRPDDPRLLLGRERLAAVRMADVQLESGGRIVRLATDPAVSPDMFRLNFNDIEVELSSWGISAAWGADEAVDPTKRLVFPDGILNRQKLEQLAKLNPAVKEFQTAWQNPKMPVTVTSWLRLAEGEHELQILSGREFSAELNGENSPSVRDKETFKTVLKVESAGIEQELKIVFPVTEHPISEQHVIEIKRVEKPGSSTFSPLSSGQLLVPWAPETPAEAVIAIAPPPYELSGGNAAKGREVFNSNTAKCATCHTIDGQGAKIGPDLTGLRGKNPGLVFHHINAPSDRIHPGYPSFSIALKSGQVAMGVVRSLGFNEMEVTDTDAKSLKFNPNEIEDLRSSTSSIMPSGLAGTVGESSMRDLIAFLTGSTDDK